MPNFKKQAIIIFVTGFITIFAFVGISTLTVFWQIVDRDRNFKSYSSYLRLVNLANGLSDYNTNNRVWPTNLNQLIVARPDLGPNMEDGYGRPVVFLPFKDSIGYGAIVSYGRDGKPGGGNRFDRDIEIRFPMDASANAQWNQQMTDRFKTRAERGIP